MFSGQNTNKLDIKLLMKFDYLKGIFSVINHNSLSKEDGCETYYIEKQYNSLSMLGPVHMGRSYPG
jgi:hypothetical protein